MTTMPSDAAHDPNDVTGPTMEIDISSGSRASRLLILAYGAVCYAACLASLVYAIGFIAGIGVPKTLDVGGGGGTALTAVLVNLALLGVFAVQHSVMARPGFKAALTRRLPDAVERPTYVLASSVALALLMALWRPLPELVWDIQAPLAATALTALHWAGWAIMLTATFMVDHFDLFGLKQVWLNLRGRSHSEPRFVVRGFYRFMRHPIQTGFLIAFWATPTMSVGHLLFALGATGYILVALQFEERDLIRVIGPRYERYREQVAMFFPVRRYQDA